MAKDKVDPKEVAARKILKAISSKVYVAMVRRPAKCKGCGSIEELREEYCYECLKPYLDRLEDEYNPTKN